MNLHSELLLSGDPGLDSRTAQFLRACIFAALWPTGPKIIFFERSDLNSLGKREKKHFPALLWPIMVSQITLKSYHN